MSVQFSRTVRSLNDNSINPLVAWLVVLLVVWLLWSSWLVWGRVPVFSTATVNEVTETGLVEATFSADQEGLIRPGQPVQLIDEESGEQVEGVVYEVAQSAENDPITVTILPKESLPEAFSGKVSIETARLSPLRLLLITLESQT